MANTRSSLNTGHGHVYPRPDGVKARCGGPPICPECAKDLAWKNLEDASRPMSKPSAIADAALEKIISDIHGRAVLGRVWDEIDVDLRNEIIRLWREFIISAVNERRP